MKIVVIFLFITYLTVSNAESGDIASRIDNYWQRRMNMGLTQNNFQPSTFEPPSQFALNRRNEFDLPPIELPVLPLMENPPFPPFPPVVQFEQPPVVPFEQPPVVPFEQPPPPPPVYEPTPELETRTEPADSNRRQNNLDQSLHLSRRHYNYDPTHFEPIGLDRRHNMPHHNNGVGLSPGKEMVNSYQQRHLPMHYTSNDPCSGLKSPLNYPMPRPVLSPCEALCGTQKNGNPIPKFPQYATHGMNSMGMAVV